MRQQALSYKVAATLILTGFAFILSACSHSDPACDRIVKMVQALDCPRDTLLRFYTDMDDTAEVLHPLAAGKYTLRGKGRGNVWVFRTSADLTVFIETQDKGHAGRNGKAWTQSDTGPIWKTDDWGETWEVGRSIGSHWWQLNYFLMD